MGPSSAGKLSPLLSLLTELGGVAVVLLSDVFPLRLA